MLCYEFTPTTQRWEYLLVIMLVKKLESIGFQSSMLLVKMLLKTDVVSKNVSKR